MFRVWRRAQAIAGYVKLCEITCKLCADYVKLRATHIIIRAWRGAQVIDRYVKLCEITCKLCEIM